MSLIVMKKPEEEMQPQIGSPETMGEVPFKTIKKHARGGVLHLRRWGFFTQKIRFWKVFLIDIKGSLGVVHYLDTEDESTVKVFAFSMENFIKFDGRNKN